jgi:hypothetical protein
MEENPDTSAEFLTGHYRWRAASLLDGCGQEPLRFAEKRAADLDGEDQALDFEDVQEIAQILGVLLLWGFAWAFLE